VMPLEGLWWSGQTPEFRMDRKDLWKWTAMIAQPDFITDDLFAKARDELAKKKDVPGLSAMRLERFHEGLSAQVLHIGPYSAEPPTIERLHRHVRETGHTLRGKHHEIYMGDPRRAAPEKLKTIIRQPIA